ncbi:MAG TPA: PEGA domain-containing protein [Thermoanaerobaculia bacterium]|nr:PEGA domain-containing protein [Thermoanaerobaculia bacterium]
MRLGAAALVLVVLVPALANAQPDAVRKKKARELLIEGDKKLKRGDQLSKRGKMEDAFAEFELGLVDYQAAFESYPDPQIYFPIAQAEHRLGRFVEALQHYQQLLAEGRNITPALRDTVERELQEIKKNLASVVLDVKQDGAVILIDGREAARTPTVSPIWVEPGQHTYAVTAKGFTPVEGKMDLLPGKELRRKIVLEPMPVVMKGGGEEPDGQGGGAISKTAPASASPPSRTPLWIGLGVTGALAVGGSITGFAALSKHSKYRDESLSDTQREDARRDGKQLAGITDVLLGGAVVSALVAAYYYYGVYQPRAQAAGEAQPSPGAVDVEDEEAFRITPFVGDGSAGVAASGSFW